MQKPGWTNDDQRAQQALFIAFLMNVAGLGHLVPFMGETDKKKPAQKKVSAAKIERGTSSASDSDWLEGTAFARQQSSKKQSKKNK